MKTSCPFTIAGFRNLPAVALPLVCLVAASAPAQDFIVPVRFTDRVTLQSTWNNITGKWQINGTEVTPTAAELNILDASAVEDASKSNGVTRLTTTIVPVKQITLTLTNVTLIATDGSAEGESQQIGAFPDGDITVLNVVCCLTNISSVGATNTYVMSVGTAAAADDATLTSTEANLIPSTSVDTTAGTVRTNAVKAVLAAPANFDGTSSAVAIFLNYGIADADMDKNVTNNVTGYVKVTYVAGPDNQ